MLNLLSLLTPAANLHRAIVYFCRMLYYIMVFVTALLVDIIPFIGPPAWMVMVALQTLFDLDVVAVLLMGVIGSTAGRYIYSLYIPLLSERLLTKQKSEDIQFIGQRLETTSWRVQFFVFLYTLLPMPSTPLFTAAGIAKIKPLQVLPSFFMGKLIIDAVMLMTGNYAVKNLSAFSAGMLSWKSLSGTILGLALVLIFLFIDWRSLLQEKKFRLKFNIWK